MLVYRKGDEVIETAYKSSNVVYSKYNRTTKILSVVFSSGKQYVYEDVPLKEFIKFELAESQGKHFNKYIAKKYKYDKGNDVDVPSLINSLNSEIQEILENTDKNK